jgi:hypothetical protein
MVKMKRRIVLLSTVTVFFTVFTPSPAMAVETSVTVTFAAGGVAGGIYFMLYITTGDGGKFNQHLWKDRALVTYAARTGWRLGFPRLKCDTSCVSPGVPSVELIRYEF